MPESSTPSFVYDEKNHCYYCKGHWTILELHHLPSSLEDMLNNSGCSPEMAPKEGLPTATKKQTCPSIIAPVKKSPKHETLTLDAQRLTKMDSAGALLFIQFMKELRKAGYTVTICHLAKPHKELLALIESRYSDTAYASPQKPRQGWLYTIGEETVYKLLQAHGLIILVGNLTEKIAGIVSNKRKLHTASLIAILHSTGVTALPIIGLLSFLIGIVLAYQMGLQLETYGANIFIAYLSGMAIFREFSPLITAIIVAGRTSSAFTAQLGSMKINEEIDAINTMGLSATELLVVPKILGLLLVFPLLIFWSDFFSVLGAMIMSKTMLNVGYMDFMARLQDSVGSKQILLGLYKAPTFALLIALVGCFQGFQVKANSDSIGQQTTKSVVQALFLIIIADAIYSIIYSWLGI